MLSRLPGSDRLVGGSDESYVYPVRRYLRRVRPSRGRVYQEVFYEPGEAMQIDWGDAGRLHIGKTTRRVSMFVAVLCYSRLCYIEFSLSQRKADFCRGVYADGHEESWLVVTTASNWSARHIRDRYGLRKAEAVPAVPPCPVAKSGPPPLPTPGRPPRRPCSTARAGRRRARLRLNHSLRPVLLAEKPWA